jgi:hypothetical protein
MRVRSEHAVRANLIVAVGAVQVSYCDVALVLLECTSFVWATHQPHDIVASSAQPKAHISADEPTCAGNENSHSAILQSIKVVSAAY